MAQEKQEPAVAVVVVHGVADQKPSESARQIANLLTDLCPLGTYSTFVEEEIRVPVEAVGPRGAGSVSRSPFEERNADARARHHSSGAVSEPPGVTFMRDQLREYAPDERSVFETVRLGGRHNETGRDIDVYEAYWADLSRPANSLFSFFGQLYQLLLHLPSLGRNALDYARAAYAGRPEWRLFSVMQRWSVRWLTLLIVTLNLALVTLVAPLVVGLLVQADSRWIGGLSVALPGLEAAGGRGLSLAAAAVVQDYQWRAAAHAGLLALLSLLPAGVALGVWGGLNKDESVRWRILRVALGTVAAGGALLLLRLSARLIRASYSAWPSMGELLPLAILGLAALIAVGYGLRRPRPLPAAVWALAPALAVVAAMTGGVLLSALYGAVWLLTLEAWVVSAIVVGRILGAYDRMRPGAKPLGYFLLVLIFLLLVYAMHRPPAGSVDEQREVVVGAILLPVQLVNIALELAWRIHVPWMLATVATGLLCAAFAPRERPAAWRTLWTVATTLALSTALFANLTLAAWSALFNAVRRLLDSNVAFTPLPVPPLLAAFLRLPMNADTVGEYIEETIAISASSAFIVITVVLAVYLLVAMWSIFPSVWIESFPPGKVDATTRRTRGLGAWLSRGLVVIPWAAWMFTLLFVGLLAYAAQSGVPDAASWQAVSAAGVLLLALFGARFWLPGASAGLDVILDVDNYLRHHPKDNTPRARMAARYASLLRFLVTPARSGRVYDRIVIIAHSQGTVITADLLRYLQVDVPDLAQSLRERHTSLFTMGSPLAQLYGRAFPWLYDWVWRSERGASPVPEELGVSRWVNAYRSGDYIGRELWRDGADERCWQRRFEDPQDAGCPEETPFNGGRSLEMCLGEGAHTHYWDHHGRDVAWQLNQMIAGDGEGRIPEPP